jgi:hypothetical protein
VIASLLLLLLLRPPLLLLLWSHCSACCFGLLSLRQQSMTAKHVTVAVLYDGMQTG